MEITLRTKWLVLITAAVIPAVFFFWHASTHYRDEKHLCEAQWRRAKHFALNPICTNKVERAESGADDECLRREQIVMRSNVLCAAERMVEHHWNGFSWRAQWMMIFFSVALFFYGLTLVAKTITPSFLPTLPHTKKD